MKRVKETIVNVKIYLRDKRCPIADVDCENESIINEFIENLNSSDRYVRFGQLIVNKTEFKWAEISYKVKKRGAK